MLRSIAAHKTLYEATQKRVVPRADASNMQASQPTSEHPLIQRRQQARVPSPVFQEAIEDKSVKEEAAAVEDQRREDWHLR